MIIPDSQNNVELYSKYQKSHRNKKYDIEIGKLSNPDLLGIKINENSITSNYSIFDLFLLQIL